MSWSRSFDHPTHNIFLEEYYGSDSDSSDSDSYPNTHSAKKKEKNYKLRAIKKSQNLSSDTGAENSGDPKPDKSSEPGVEDSIGLETEDTKSPKSVNDSKNQKPERQKNTTESRTQSTRKNHVPALKPGVWVAVGIYCTMTEYDIRWQDGTFEKSIPYHKLQPVYFNIDEHDFFPGYVVSLKNCESVKMYHVTWCTCSITL